MLWIGLLILFLFLCGFFIKLEWVNTGCFFGFLACVMFFTSIFQFMIGSDKYVGGFTIPIYSLEKTTELSGSFVLGTGSFGTDRKYYFYKEVEDGVILDSVYAEYTPVKETNDTKPCLLVKEYNNYNRWYNLIGCKTQKYVLVVPENTITKEFKL